MSNLKSKITNFWENHSFFRRFTKFFIGFIIFLFVFDNVLMPWYVYEEDVEVPNLLNKTKTEAEIILSEHGLGYYIAGIHKSDSVPLNHILNQIPEPKSIVKKGRKIAIYVSGGENLIKIPELTGKKSIDAQLLCNKLGLVISRIDTLESLNPRGTVVRQSLSPNTEVTKGTKLVITISSGPPEANIVDTEEMPENQDMVTRVPNLFGLSFNEAKKMLDESNLSIGRISKISSEDLLPNTVMDQHPAPDKKVKKGSPVDLVLVGL